MYVLRDKLAKGVTLPIKMKFTVLALVAATASANHLSLPGK
jgi:hypothetical protein